MGVGDGDGVVFESFGVGLGFGVGAGVGGGVGGGVGSGRPAAAWLRPVHGESAIAETTATRQNGSMTRKT